MLGFIRNYRNSPERTVLSVKCKHSFYLLKKKHMVNCCEISECDSMQNKTKKNVHCHTNDSEMLPECQCNEYALECENAALSGNKKDQSSKYAFKVNECCIDVDNGFCVNETLEYDGCYHDEKSDFNKTADKEIAHQGRLKKKEKSAKGALVCRKTYRILLCDAVACFVLIVLAMPIIVKLVFKKK